MYRPSDLGRPICPEDVVLLEDTVERMVIYKITLKHVVAALHRTHGGSKYWWNCDNRFCLMAHDAVEGKLKPKPAVKVVALIPK